MTKIYIKKYYYIYFLTKYLKLNTKYIFIKGNESDRSHLCINKS